MLELGVDVTSNCTPVIRNGPLIGDTIQLSTKLSWHVPDIELSAISFMLQLVSFRDGDFTHISHGFPRRITNDLCVKCLPQATKTNTIASGCTVGPAKPVHGVSIGVKMTDGAFLAVVTGMNVTSSVVEDGKNRRVVRQFHGMGDVTRTVHTQYVVTFVSKDENVPDKEQSSGHTLQYWEYSNQDHISKLCNAAIDRQKTDTPIVTEVANGPVYRRSITCDTNTVHMTQFMRALLVYRTVQMENIQRPAEFIPVAGTVSNATEGRSTTNSNRKRNGSFDALTVSDVYRAILAVKVAEELPADSEVASGTFFEYPQCATYNWRFAIPTVVALLCIALLGMSVLHMRSKPAKGNKSFMCSAKGTKGDGDGSTEEKIGAALKMLQDSDSFISDASSAASHTTCGNSIHAVRLMDKCDDLMHRKRLPSDVSSIGACGDFDALSIPSTSTSTTSSDSDGSHNGFCTINMDQLTTNASAPPVPTSQQHGGGLVTHTRIVLSDSGSLHGGDQMLATHGSGRGTNSVERMNGRRLWSLPCLAEANQIVVMRNERNEVSGIRVIPFEESPAGIERTASNISW